MKRLLAGLALAVGAAIVLQKSWTGAQPRGPRQPRERKSRRTGEPRGEMAGLQPEPHNGVSRAPESSASRSAEGKADRQQDPLGKQTVRNAAEVLNSATRQQLLSVYGIGPVLADRIIQNRPYAAAYDVVEKEIIPESIFVQLRKQLLDQYSA